MPDNESSSAEASSPLTVPESSASSTPFCVDKPSMQSYNLNVPFKGLFNAVKKNSGVKKLSTSTIALLASCDISKMTLSKKLAKVCNSENEMSPALFPVVKPTWRHFRYSELASATDNFNKERFLGMGGHAEVFKGYLADGTEVAVKKLIKSKQKIEEERVADFLSELGIIAHVSHKNAAKLIGFGVEHGLYLVLQFCPNGSLASHLHGSREGLQWSVRYRVAVGVAKGLSYMHHDCPRRIIHRDIKGSNILLDEDFEPLISDFGLAKWLPDKWLHHVVYPIEGTFGYLAPEYFMHGIVDEKIDVFAFGVLLLELLTGRYAVDASRQSLVMWAKPLLESNSIKELIDPVLGDDYDPDELERYMLIASLCINHEPNERPFMNRVVEILQGVGGPIEMKQNSVSKSMLITDTCDLKDYNCTSYLRDLSRHMQLVME